MTEVYEMEKVKVGIDGVDALLGGGLPKGRTILLAGACGTGKTIFAAQFALMGAKSKENCVFITFEQGKKKLIEDMKQIKINFEKMENDGYLKIIGGPIGHIRYFKEMTKADMTNIAGEIEEVAKEINAKRVVVDSVNLYLMLFEKDSEKRNALAELVSTLEKLSCTSLLTCEVKEGTKDISWYGFEEFVVDGVIILYRIPVESLFERSISIVKMRGMPHSQSIATLKIEKDGIKVYPEQKAFYKVD